MNPINNPVNKNISTKLYKLKKKSKRNIITNINDIDNDGVSIITIVRDDNSIDTVFSYYENLIFQRKEMIIALNSTACNIENWLNNSRKYSMVRVYWLGDLTYDECIKYCANRSIYLNLVFFCEKKSPYF